MDGDLARCFVEPLIFEADDSKVLEIRFREVVSNLRDTLWKVDSLPVQLPSALQRSHPLRCYGPVDGTGTRSPLYPSALQTTEHFRYGHSSP